MKNVYFFLTVSLALSALSAQADWSGKSCSDPEALSKAELVLGNSRNESRLHKIPGSVSVTVDNCSKQSFAEATGIPRWALAYPQVCGIRVTFKDQKSLEAFAYPVLAITDRVEGSESEYDSPKIKAVINGNLVEVPLCIGLAE